MIDRTTILKGPGFISYDGATILSDGDIEATLIVETEDVDTSAFGVVDARVIDKRIEVTVTPKKWSNLSVLLPYATTPIGASIFGGTDKPLTITTADDSLVVANAAVTTLPPLTLRTRGGGSIIGAMTFTGLIANSSDPGAAASYYSFGAGGEFPTLNLSDIKTEVFSASFDSTTIKADEGFSVAWNLSLANQVADDVGTYDMRLQDFTATASCIPRGMTASALAGLLAFGTGIGAAPTKSSLAITGSGSVSLTLNSCFARQGQYRAGRDVHRTGTLEFQAVRAFAEGAPAPLFTVA